MPAKRRRSKRRAALTDMQLRWLRGERSFYGLLNGRDIGWNAEEVDKTLAVVWAENREWVLAEYIAEHPGTRPKPWWQFDAPEPRPENETEATYLDRHRLFLPGERRRLKAADFEPEAVISAGE